MAQRERGVWWCDLSREIDVSAETLKRWATPRSTQFAVREVQVIDVPLAGTVTLVAPSGLRIEGIDVETAIAILRGLA